jgi:hypothetical protein
MQIGHVLKDAIKRLPGAEQLCEKTIMHRFAVTIVDFEKWAP